MNEKLYLYGVVHAQQDRSFGPVGLSTQGTPNDILLKAHQGFGVIYSAKDIGEDDEIPATRKNLINHQKVIETVMTEMTILPFSFGTVVDNEQQIFDLMEQRKDEFAVSLDKIDGKIELSLKVMWESMDPIFMGLMEENEAIKTKKEYLAVNNIQDQNEKIELGRMVEEALLAKKDEMANRVTKKLQPLALDMKVQKNITEAMFANLAFFLSAEDEKKFDKAVNDLSDELSENIVFKYVGPIAPFNFL